MLFCTVCGRYYRINDYLNEIDEELWQLISSRRCDRV
jgi:uncharacterized protein YbaR (Trm112 family)